MIYHLSVKLNLIDITSFKMIANKLTNYNKVICFYIVDPTGENSRLCPCDYLQFNSYRNNAVFSIQKRLLSKLNSRGKNPQKMLEIWEKQLEVTTYTGSFLPSPDKHCNNSTYELVGGTLQHTLFGICSYYCMKKWELCFAAL